MSESENIPYGYCHCGCGRKTSIATQNDTRHGYVKGEPKKFVKSHSIRTPRTHCARTPRVARCDACGAEFEPRTTASRFCSTDCAHRRSGADHPGWKGGLLRRDDRLVRYVGRDHPMADAKGYAYEHRLVMAEHLGRNLASDELVHHVNEDPMDNRIENLELMTWAEHSAHHRKNNGFAAEPPRGERHSMSKLTETQVREIRARATGNRGEGRIFAEQYGVSRSTISAILKGRLWKHLT